MDVQINPVAKETATAVKQEDWLHFSHHEEEQLRFRLTARNRSPGLGELHARPGHMLISIKNRAFSDKLIGRWCAWAAKRLPHAYITIVDAPYIHNIAAQTDDREEQKRREERLFQLAEERGRQMARILRRPGNEDLTMMPWNELASAVHPWLDQEIRDAYERGGAFYDAVNAHCRATIADYDAALSPKAFELFLIEELPVLLYVYYCLDGGLSDFYPGPNPTILWQIEEGVFADDLPKTTELAKSHPGLIYGEIAVVK